jgi:hypothetical protein
MSYSASNSLKAMEVSLTKLGLKTRESLAGNFLTNKVLDLANYGVRD